MDPYQSIFIGGTGRSGTNILKKLLAELPEASALPFEPRYLIDPDGVFDLYESKMWSPYVIDFKIRRLKKLLMDLSRRDALDRLTIVLYDFLKINKRVLTPTRYQKWELDRHIPGFSEHARQFLEEIVELKYPSYWCGSDSFRRNNYSLFAGRGDNQKVKQAIIQFIDRNITSYLKYQNASVYIDDSTFNILHARSIYELCRYAKMIHIFRDPRDVVVSLMQQKWAPDDLDAAITWYKSVIHEWEHQKSLTPDHFYLEIRFEDLIHDFKGVIKQIDDFTGVGFSELTYQTSFKKAHIGRWKEELPADQQEKLHSALSEELKLLGYL